MNRSVAVVRRKRTPDYQKYLSILSEERGAKSSYFTPCVHFIFETIAHARYDSLYCDTARHIDKSQDIAATACNVMRVSRTSQLYHFCYLVALMRPRLGLVAKDALM